VLSALVAGLMILQPVLGLAVPGQYHDAEWIRTTWYGNDWVTLVVAAPLLVTALLPTRRNSLRGRLLWMGMLGYGVYNYAFYLLGVALNAYFPLYALTLVLSGVALILVLSDVDPNTVAAGFAARTPVRMIGGYLLIMAVGLAVVWLATWAAYAFAGRPTPVEPEAFRLVAALDLTIMIPALGAGGVLLWRGRPWGYVLAPLAGVQGALYLLVLSVSSVVAISRGLVEAPGELPIWAPLGLGTALATALMLKNASGGTTTARRPDDDIDTGQ
jgi:hypothetical protein